MTPLAACPKCEAEDIDVTHLASLRLHDIMTPEFLRCHCKLCGYIWAEPTSDAKE